MGCTLELTVGQRSCTALHLSLGPKYASVGLGVLFKLWITFIAVNTKYSNIKYMKDFK